VLHVDVSDGDLAKRRVRWKPPPPRYTSGVLAKYAKTGVECEWGGSADAGI